MTYEGRSTKGGRFRNTEIFTLRDGQVIDVEYILGGRFRIKPRPAVLLTSVIPGGCRASMAFEKLYFPLVLFGFVPCFERPEIAATAPFGDFSSGVEPVLTGFQFSNHGCLIALGVPKMSRAL